MGTPQKSIFSANDNVGIYTKKYLACKRFTKIRSDASYINSNFQGRQLVIKEK
jgi:hypothetical protein